MRRPPEKPAYAPEGKGRQDRRDVESEFAPGACSPHRCRVPVGETTRRLAQRQYPKCEQQAGKTDSEEGGLPAGEPERRGTGA